MEERYSRWMEERAGRRINEARVEQAVETGAEIIATVCPLCMISLDSAIKVLNLDDRLQVMDILEWVGERMKPPHPTLSLWGEGKGEGVRGLLFS